MPRKPSPSARDRRVEVDRVDLVQHVGQRLEQRVDLELDVGGLPRARRAATTSPDGRSRRKELHRLGAEDGVLAICTVALDGM